MSVDQLPLPILNESEVALNNTLLAITPAQYLREHDNTLSLMRPHVAKNTPNEGLKIMLCRPGERAAITVYVGFKDVTSLLFEWLSSACLTKLPEPILHAACELWLQKYGPESIHTHCQIVSVQHFSDPVTAASGQHLVRFPVSITDTTSQLYVLTEDTLWPELLGGLAQTSADNGTIPLDVSLQLANIRLDTTALASLEYGDVLLCGAEKDLVTLLLNGSPFFLATIKPGQITLTKYWSQTMNDTPDPMPRGTTQTIADDAQNAPDISALPVNIQLRLPMKTLTVAQAQQLTEGHTLTLSAGAEKQIALCINDQIMGRGELVNIDGQLGVLIAQWSSHGH